MRANPEFLITGLGSSRERGGREREKRTLTRPRQAYRTVEES
jgi:hypothetical protein